MLPLMVQKLPIDIVVEWDPEASVWVGTTDDIYGFGIEDADLDRLVRRAPDIMLDLFELNYLLMPEGQHDIPFKVHVSPIGYATARIA